MMLFRFILWNGWIPLATALISSTAMAPAWAETLDGVEGKHGIAMHGDLTF